MNIPNQLTLIRVALLPTFILVFYLPVEWNYAAACFVFVLAAVTDIFDGYLARKLQQTSKLGAFLDPVADKLMVSVSLVVLVQRDPSFILVCPAVIIIWREITVSALREWMAMLGEGGQIAVSSFGKFKTIVQMTAVSFLIYQKPLWGLPIYGIGLVLIYIASILTVWSMVCYLLSALPNMKENNE